MKMTSALGSWFRGRLEGRWQWIALIGILALFNTAEDACYSFRIEPNHVGMDVGEKNRELRVRDWVGTLDISHKCSPELVTVTWNNSTGTINISANSRGLWGKCLITAIDIPGNGTIRYTTATVEVFKHPMHAHVVTPNLASCDFGNMQTLKPDEEIYIYVEGGVVPYSQVGLIGSWVLDFTPYSPAPNSFSVRALKAGQAYVYIKDGGDPPDVLMLNFEVR